jgi:hypothetical protein
VPVLPHQEVVQDPLGPLLGFQSDDETVVVVADGVVRFF